MEDFKVIRSEQVYSGRVVGLSRETIVLPDGSEAVREVVRHPGAVAMVPLLSSTEVILLRQFRYPARKTLWEIPAGTIEPNETPAACAERELTEEIGYRARTMSPLGGFFTSPGFCSEFIHLFVATGLEPYKSKPDRDERLEPHKMPLEEAIHKIETGEIMDAKTIAGLLKVSLLNAGRIGYHKLDLEEER